MYTITKANHQNVNTMNTEKTHIKEVGRVKRRRAVSYTHLDVYKRQVGRGAPIELVLSGPINSKLAYACLTYAYKNF